MLLTPTSPAWLTAWNHSNDREVFAHPAYAALFEDEKTRACAFFRESEKGSILYPLLLRELRGEPFWKPEDGELLDMVTPYGYGGPVVVAGEPSQGLFLSVNEISGAFGGGDLFLKDLSTGGVHNLGQQPEYSFQAVQGDDPARFIITFAQPTNVPTIGESLVNVYTRGQTLYVNFTEEAGNRLLQVYDLSGRMVMSHKLSHGLSHTRQLNVEQGVYIVRISSPAGVATQRVFVK